MKIAMQDQTKLEITQNEKIVLDRMLLRSQFLIRLVNFFYKDECPKQDEEADQKTLLVAGGQEKLTDYAFRIIENWDYEDSKSVMFALTHMAEIRISTLELSSNEREVLRNFASKILKTALNIITEPLPTYKDLRNFCIVIADINQRIRYRSYLDLYHQCYLWKQSLEAFKDPFAALLTYESAFKLSLELKACLQSAQKIERGEKTKSEQEKMRERENFSLILVDFYRKKAQNPKVVDLSKEIRQLTLLRNWALFSKTILNIATENKIIINLNCIADVVETMNAIRYPNNFIRT
jgi:hypothetical protein